MDKERVKRGKKTYFVAQLKIINTKKVLSVSLSEEKYFFLSRQKVKE